VLEHAVSTGDDAIDPISDNLAGRSFVDVISWPANGARYGMAAVFRSRSGHVSAIEWRASTRAPTTT
jgi:hypothetical protein